MAKKKNKKKEIPTLASIMKKIASKYKRLDYDKQEKASYEAELAAVIHENDMARKRKQQAEQQMAMQSGQQMQQMQPMQGMQQMPQQGMQDMQMQPAEMARYGMRMENGGIIPLDINQVLGYMQDGGNFNSNQGVRMLNTELDVAPPASYPQTGTEMEKSLPSMSGISDIDFRNLLSVQLPKTQLSQMSPEQLLKAKQELMSRVDAPYEKPWIQSSTPDEAEAIRRSQQEVASKQLMQDQLNAIDQYLQGKTKQTQLEQTYTPSGMTLQYGGNVEPQMATNTRTMPIDFTQMFQLGGVPKYQEGSPEGGGIRQWWQSMTKPYYAPDYTQPGAYAQQPVDFEAQASSKTPSVEEAGFGASSKPLHKILKQEERRNQVGKTDTPVTDTTGTGMRPLSGAEWGLLGAETLSNIVSGAQVFGKDHQQPYRKNPFMDEAVNELRGLKVDFQPVMNQIISRDAAAQKAIRNASRSVSGLLGNIQNLTSNTQQQLADAKMKEDIANTQIGQQRAATLGTFGEQERAHKLTVDDLRARDEAARDVAKGQFADKLSGIPEFFYDREVADAQSNEALTLLRNQGFFFGAPGNITEYMGRLRKLSSGDQAQLITWLGGGARSKKEIEDKFNKLEGK